MTENEAPARPTGGVIEDRITVTARYRCDACGTLMDNIPTVDGPDARLHYKMDRKTGDEVLCGRFDPVRLVEPTDDPQPTDASQAIARWHSRGRVNRTIAGINRAWAAAVAERDELGDALAKALEAKQQKLEAECAAKRNASRQNSKLSDQLAAAQAALKETDK